MTKTAPATAPGSRPLRADAVRNRSMLLRTAFDAFRDHGVGASLDDIAKAAGVGRMTLYGHFRTRPELIEAALIDALRLGEETLSAVDLGGDPRAAMTRLIESSWSLVAESSALVAAAQGVLPPGRLRELHAGAANRVEDLIRRGQDDGVFRTDLPMTWLVSAVHYVLKGAAEENRAGRVETGDVARLVTTTALSILAAPSPAGTTD